VPRANQRTGGIPSLNTREEPHHGCGCGRCLSQVWNVAVKIMGIQLSNSDAKIDSLSDAVKALVQLSTVDKNQLRNQNEPQVRNPNFRRQQGPPVPQVMPRGPRNPNEQHIRSPF
jgi:hypothetical protein